MIGFILFQILQLIPANPPATTRQTIPAPLRPARVSTVSLIWRPSARVMTGRWGLLSPSTRTRSYTEPMSKMEGLCCLKGPRLPLKGTRNKSLWWDKDVEDGRICLSCCGWFQWTLFLFWRRHTHENKQELKKKLNWGNKLSLEI